MKESARLTGDITPEEYKHLKVLEELEDNWLIEKAKETIHRIESGQEKTIPWKKVKNR